VPALEPVQTGTTRVLSLSPLRPWTWQRMMKATRTRSLASPSRHPRAQWCWLFLGTLAWLGVWVAGAFVWLVVATSAGAAGCLCPCTRMPWALMAPCTHFQSNPPDLPLLSLLCGRYVGFLVAALQICTQFLDSINSFVWTRAHPSQVGTSVVPPFLVLVLTTVIVLGTMIVSVRDCTCSPSPLWTPSSCSLSCILG
jgi:hypothetical protein